MPNEAFKKIVAAPVASVLKPAGFRKSGLNFIALRPGVKLLVNLQCSHSSSAEALKVTCNIGILVDRLAVGPRPGIWEAHWRERIGAFLPEREDRWWECRNEEEARKAGDEIADLLQHRALAVMEQLATPDAMAALWSSEQAPGLTERQREDNLKRILALG